MILLSLFQGSVSPLSETSSQALEPKLLPHPAVKRSVSHSYASLCPGVSSLGSWVYNPPWEQQVSVVGSPLSPENTHLNFYPKAVWVSFHHFSWGSIGKVQKKAEHTPKPGLLHLNTKNACQKGKVSGIQSLII